MWTLYTSNGSRYIKLYHASRLARARELAYHMVDFIKKTEPACAIVITDNPLFLYADDTPEYPYLVFYDDKNRRMCCEVIKDDSIKDYILYPDGRLGRRVPHVI